MADSAASDISDSVESRIARAIRETSVSLDIGSLGLKTLPSFSGLHWLKVLRLPFTDITNLLPLKDLDALESLDLTLSSKIDLNTLPLLPNLKTLNLELTGVRDISALAGLRALETLSLAYCRNTEIEALVNLQRLKRLILRDTEITDLTPLSALRNLQVLSLASTPVTDIGVLSRLQNLVDLDLTYAKVSDLAPLADLPKLRRLAVSKSRVIDLSPLATVVSLIDGAGDAGAAGLAFGGCPLKDKQLLRFASLPKYRRTVTAVNYLRQLQGLPPYLGKKDDDKPSLPKDAPEAIEGVPSPFDFQVTVRGTIAVAGSATNLPAFPFATSREDHARRLETCKVSSGDLIDALSAQRYHNVRQEYLAYLQRYLERLPQSAENGNMLLADGVARSLSKLFSAEAVILPDAFAAELHTLLEQHIATCAYYPEIGTFNRDVRDGKPSRPFPLMAAEALVQAVQAHTPNAFEPSVSRALSEVQISPPLPPAVSADLPPPLPQTILPPPIPGGETDPRKSQEFAKASTANRLWKVVKATATVSGASHGVIDAAQALAPHVKEMIDFLASVIESLG